MTTTDLGSGFHSAPARDELVFKSDVDTIVETAMRAVERRLEGLVKALVPKEPDAPTVNVAAPHVTVKPEITISDLDTPEVNVRVEIPGMDKVQTVLVAILAELKKPVTRTVERSQDGLIETITECRG